MYIHYYICIYIRTLTVSQLLLRGATSHVCWHMVTYADIWWRVESRKPLPTRSSLSLFTMLEGSTQSISKVTWRAKCKWGLRFSGLRFCCWRMTVYQTAPTGRKFYFSSDLKMRSAVLFLFRYRSCSRGVQTHWQFCSTIPKAIWGETDRSTRLRSKLLTRAIISGKTLHLFRYVTLKAS
jgi:hypothetical protein